MPRKQRRPRSKLSDVAARAGVSAVTVSRALRRPEMVSPQLRERIDAAIRDLAYIPNRAASILASSRSNVIGVVVSSLTNGVFADYLRALHDMFQPAGFQVMVLNSRYSPLEEEKAIVTLLGQRPEALILADVDQTPYARELLEHAGIPIVQTMGLTDTPIDINIGISQYEAGGLATRHLIDLGHRRIGTLAARLDSRTRNRVAGYTDAMKAAGYFDETLLELSPRPSTVRQGGELFSVLLARRPDLEAVFCANDDLALGALFECARRGVKVPEEMSVVGFNDLEFAASSCPALTTIAVPRHEMGRLSAEIVLEITRGSGMRPKKTRIDLGFKLALRGSTMAAAAAVQSHLW
ncbi:LacI family DNA-binding transcriptional regulator [Nordella sp. HKS 07]|uniref:LacI family DNA-binding transcriptional regulator n=1 Tax=Nordella sp. HKS 07 TaxID=2712222 RepID=UPI0013E16738|nr:LacI family DNA-binding transcriptional regulator [Nordella sp. HKS 07]QIG49768.1 LacI family DNA-binding transcriptional regulator [Nordella sp. HKS 07]